MLPSRDALRGWVHDLDMLTLTPDFLHALHIAKLKSARIRQGVRASMQPQHCMLDGKPHPVQLHCKMRDHTRPDCMPGCAAYAHSIDGRRRHCPGCKPRTAPALMLQAWNAA